jgi:hypothetical protein
MGDLLTPRERLVIKRALWSGLVVSLVGLLV